MGKTKINILSPDANFHLFNCDPPILNLNITLRSWALCANLVIVSPKAPPSGPEAVDGAPPLGGPAPNIGKPARGKC